MSSSSLSLPQHLVFPGILLIRCILALSPLPELLKDDTQLASPLSSWSRLNEGIYLFKHGIDPYSGGTFRHSPLYLSVFATLLPCSQTIAALFWTLVDAVSAWALVRIWRARSGVAANGSAREGVVLASYLLNPYLLLPSLALSTATFDNALILLTLMFASEGASSAALLCLALAAHLSLPSLLLLPPVILLLHSTPHSHLASPNSAPSPFASISSNKTRTARMLGAFAAFFSILCVASRVVAGSWSWIGSTWGAGFTLPDLTPNPGLWWYFFTEMFDHFRPFFLMVFSVHLLIYVAPLCIKFQHDPLYATFLLLGVLALFKPYPTLADPGLFTSLLVLFPETYAHLRHAPVTFLLHLHAALLLPLFHHLWTRAGTGNANFFYASTLVLGIANGALLVDCAWAGLRAALGKVRAGEKGRWVVVQQ